MNRWLKKLGNAPDSELTQLTKGGLSVLSVPRPALLRKKAYPAIAGWPS